MTIDVGRAFNLAADDERGWNKAFIYLLMVLVGVLTSFLVIPAFFLMVYIPGFLIQYTRNVATGEDNQRLPQPTQFSYLWHGLMGLLIYVVYCLPMMGAATFGFMGAAVAMSAATRLDSPAALMGTMSGLGLLGLVALGLALLVIGLLPMVTLQYCKRQNFGDAFNIPEIFAGIMRSPVDYLVVVLLPFGLNFLVGMIPFLGIFLSFLVGLVGSNLAGQYGAKVLNMYQGGRGQQPEWSGTGLNRPSDDFGSF